MESRITFLGTGTGGAITQNHRKGGGIVIQTSNYQFVLDPGPGALTSAREMGVNLRNTTAVIVSNSDIYKCNDANIILSVMTYDGFDPKGVLIANETFARGAENINPGLTKNHETYVEKVIIPSPGQKIGIENVEIHALDTQNDDPKALGFKFFTPDFVLTYTGSTGFSADIARQYEKSDILILNMVHDEVKSETELNKEDVIKIIKLVQPRLAVLTGMGLKVIKADPIQIARDIRAATKVQTIAAKDGAVMTPSSYSAGLRNRTLNLYD